MFGKEIKMAFQRVEEPEVMPEFLRGKGISKDDPALWQAPAEETRVHMEKHAVAIVENKPTATNSNNEISGFLEIIDRAIKTPDFDVEKLDRLISAQERIMAKNAEVAFNQAMTRLQLPVIKHSSEIKHKETRIAGYAKYEDIDKIIRPIYSAEGFSLSFNSKRNDDGTVTYLGTLSHKEGHSRTAEMLLPADTSGAKNNIQAIGSTVSYAKRYLVGMLLNLVTTGEDDDANSVECISTEQAVEIDLLIPKACKNIDIFKPKFLEQMKVSDVRHIRKSEYKKAMNILNAKLQGAK